MANKEYWDNLWAASDQLNHTRLHTPEDEYLSPAVLASISRYLGSAPIRFLEAGCGLGFWNFRLLGIPRLELSVGLDLSESLYQAQAYKERQGIKDVHFLRGNLTAIPFRSGEFNLVTSFGVVEHFPKPQEPIMEMKRVLSPGGILFLDTPNKGPWAWRTRFFPIDEHEDYYRPQELADILALCGFEILECFARGFSNAIMTPLYEAYPYSPDSFSSRGYHFALRYLKRGIKPLDRFLDKKHGFYSIVIARKPL